MDKFNFTDSDRNKKILKSMIEKLIFKKYPKLLDIEDIEHWSSSFRGDTYTIHITTSECLDEHEMMEIDTEIKTLGKMISLSNANDNPFSVNSSPKFMVFFDCGDGEGFVFKSTYGYTH
jgi:hypothetical protein